MQNRESCSKVRPPSNEDERKVSLSECPSLPPSLPFPKDIFPIFQQPQLVETLVTHIVHHILTTSAQLKEKKVDVIVGLDARGFLLGPLIALRLGCAFVPVRKRGKLPGETVTVGYEKEYGTDYFDIQKESIKCSQRVIILDDLIGKLPILL